MSKFVQAVRGMNDLLPEVLETWQRVEQTARELLLAYGYREIRVPLVERTELFSRSIGQTTDIVSKEMYSFEDRNGESLSLRPEATAGIVRAGIEHGFLHNQVQRLWHAGPMFRHERPQKGRYRQFHQIDVEAFGMAGPEIDAELILLGARLWRALGISDLRLEINSLGTPEARTRYRQGLVRYLEERRAELDEDSVRRLDTNPLRILDSKDSGTRAVLAEAPSLLDHLDEPSQRHFQRLQAYLRERGLSYTVNPQLVRGLDYYTHTVFEWTTERLGAQGAVCGGGRYDGLIEQLGGRPAPASGFAIGMERLVELLLQAASAPTGAGLDAYLTVVGDGREISLALGLAEQLRDAGLRVECDCGGGSLKSQMRRADRSGARFALLLGEAEAERGMAGVKDLRADAAQQEVAQAELAEYLGKRLR